MVRGREKNPSAAGSGGRGKRRFCGGDGKRGLKKVKNKLPGGIDKKIPARFFHQIQMGWTVRTGGGGGRKPDRTRGGSRMYIYTHGVWMGISSRRRIVWRRAPGGYQLIRNTPACYPPVL